PVHTQPWYERLGFTKGDYQEAERYYAEAISLPMYPTMTEEQQDLVVDTLRRAVTG
ncbi:DegT/DnrJ/EryC1/StrS family aminotransferase, partial [Methanocalculus sp.]|uniref:DegT/DnrJ/EryC1/StrS family aminotransferase n=1 Tax=Methanocalculus sp. TaxID=2004547 RepID=UPI003455559F